MKKIILATVAILSLSVPAHAAARCGARGMFVKVLNDTYKEVPKHMAIAGPYVLEVFVSPEGTFTIMTTAANGVSCLIAAGQGWAPVKPEIPGENS